MAYLLKKSSLEERGILIFNQKEFGAFSKIKSIERVKNNYIFGCHVGCYWKNCEWSESQIKQFDFYMSSKNQLPDNFPAKIIEINSRNFTPEIFNYSNELKDIDILWINKPHPVKNIEKFLISLKHLFINHGKFKTLIIAAISPNEIKRPDQFFNIKSFLDANSKIFEDSVTLIRTQGEGNEGAPNHTMAEYYKRSKIFAFYSEVEGESRVVTEALCCNCKVVFYKNVKGGSNDYCNLENSFKFDNYENSHLTILEALKSFKVIDNSNIYKKCHSQNSIENLVNFFKKDLYPSLGIKLLNDKLEIPSGNWSNGKEKLGLNFSLPGHDHNVPWKQQEMETGDLSSEQRFINIFLNENNI